MNSLVLIVTLLLASGEKRVDTIDLYGVMGPLVCSTQAPSIIAERERLGFYPQGSEVVDWHCEYVRNND